MANTTLTDEHGQKQKYDRNEKFALSKRTAHIIGSVLLTISGQKGERLTKKSGIRIFRWMLKMGLTVKKFTAIHINS